MLGDINAEHLTDSECEEGDPRAIGGGEDEVNDGEEAAGAKANAMLHSTSTAGQMGMSPTMEEVRRWKTGRMSGWPGFSGAVGS